MKNLQRLFELGPLGCWQSFVRRLNKKIFYLFYNQYTPLKKINVNQELFNANFIEKILNSTEFKLLLPPNFKSKKWILNQADLITLNCFDLLGSRLTCFEKIPWQKDFKTFNKKNVVLSYWQENQNIFYQNIKISCPKIIDLEQYNPDIKVPWELSRFQHLFILGLAYKISAKQKYALTFQQQLSDWIDKNSFPYGVNWVCPMDVAIRAINWLWGFYFFYKSKNISSEFWEKLILSLYQHTYYLEWNWESSDKPNNHYLSNLLGYLYLCEFFNSIKHFKKNKIYCINNLLHQFFHQIQEDGECYEGSTSYHRLDTELYLHFKLICYEIGVSLPQSFLNRFKKMINFLQDCTDSYDNFIQIGDNDGGKILTGLYVKPKLKSQVKTYQQFGISVIKKSNWHITFRHPTFKNTQPSGHFHQDQLAITVSIKGIPILIDPGTYVYTANSSWRNLLRSSKSHNTFDESDTESTLSDLFQLHLPNQENPIILNKQEVPIQITNSYVKNKNLTLFRTLKFNYKKKYLLLIDKIETKKETTKIEWNLIFDPNLKLEKIDEKLWLVTREKSRICQIKTSLNFTLTKGFYSKDYGFLQKCHRLVETNSKIDEKQEILIQSLLT